MKTIAHTTNLSSIHFMVEQKMKTQIIKMIVLAILGFTAFAASAQFQPRAYSILNLRLKDGAPFKVYVDGQQQGGTQNTITMNNLAEGQHYLQVYRVGRDWGYETMDNVFRGNVVITGNAESFATVYPEVGKIKFDNIIAFNNSHCNEPAEPQVCFYPKHPRPNFHPASVVTNRPTCEQAPVHVQEHCGPVAMCANDFAQLKQTISNGSFEGTRLSIFKQALAYNYFTSAQVRDLMDLFWFESSKLEMAKLAYPKTIDQNNYYIVNNGFSFSSSVNELGEYVAMR